MSIRENCLYQVLFSQNSLYSTSKITRIVTFYRDLNLNSPFHGYDIYLSNYNIDWKCFLVDYLIF